MTVYINCQKSKPIFILPKLPSDLPLDETFCTQPLCIYLKHRQEHLNLILFFHSYSKKGRLKRRLKTGYMRCSRRSKRKTNH
ncbi:F24 [Felid gammaherpesvirus 1]|uniref:F24 n=1 Tax=Felid gammaherpesvirus 1 TaxID=2560468 RepID=A0A0M4MDC9_9GAMA|nr:F24 [Felis catus gammaherpesvirus 1]ALE14788.1 F24 [Felis catus gammaherpesvirus 1]